MADSTELFDIMRTTRAMRRLKPDPVPDELIRRILEAGTYAANGGANQRWRFMVIKDRSIKERVQVWYKKAYDEVVGPRYSNSAPPPGSSPGRYRRQHDAVEYLTDHYHEAPVWIVACMEGGDGLPDRALGASIYPAVQNMLLAARALGLGSTLTSRHLIHEKEVEEILGLPPVSIPMPSCPSAIPWATSGRCVEARCRTSSSSTGGASLTLTNKRSPLPMRAV